MMKKSKNMLMKLLEKIQSYLKPKKKKKKKIDFNSEKGIVYLAKKLNPESLPALIYEMYQNDKDLMYIRSMENTIAELGGDEEDLDEFSNQHELTVAQVILMCMRHAVDNFIMVMGSGECDDDDEGEEEYHL